MQKKKKSTKINYFGMLFLTLEALKDADNCKFVPIYEDKDGDWMLAGDVLKIKYYSTD